MNTCLACYSTCSFEVAVVIIVLGVQLIAQFFPFVVVFALLFLSFDFALMTCDAFIYLFSFKQNDSNVLNRRCGYQAQAAVFHYLLPC